MKVRWRAGKPVEEQTPYRATVVVYMEPREHLKPTLFEFWDRASRVCGIVERLMLLQEFAERFVYRDQGYRQIRKGSPGIKKPRGWCWACATRKAEHRHHVIQVQHGGRNVLTNIVCLCQGCHAVVHPWMRKKAASL